MGTGIIGKLTAEQSAKAMMSAIYEFSQQGKGTGMEVTFVIFARSIESDVCVAFSKVLTEKLYQSAQKERGEKEFSTADWIIGMHKDVDANNKAFGE